MMQISEYLLERAICKDEDRKIYVPLIISLVSFSEKARRDGVLSMEQDLQEYKHLFVRLGMTLVIDGTDPTMVKKILMQSLITSELKGKELLEHIIIMEGCLAIMRGDHPEIVKINLCSLMGLNGQKILDETWKKMGE